MDFYPYKPITSIRTIYSELDDIFLYGYGATSIGVPRGLQITYYDGAPYYRVYRFNEPWGKHTCVHVWFKLMSTNTTPHWRVYFNFGTKDAVSRLRVSSGGAIATMAERYTWSQAPHMLKACLYAWAFLQDHPYEFQVDGRPFPTFHPDSLSDNEVTLLTRIHACLPGTLLQILRLDDDTFYIHYPQECPFFPAEPGFVFPNPPHIKIEPGNMAAFQGSSPNVGGRYSVLEDWVSKHKSCILGVTSP